MGPLYWRAEIVLGAGVAQLAEHNVANVVVVGSNPITRSAIATKRCPRGSVQEQVTLSAKTAGRHVGRLFVRVQKS